MAEKVLETDQEITELKRMVDIARQLNQPQVELEALKRLDVLVENQVDRSPIDIESKAKKAQAYAGFPRYDAGLIFMGRGFDNLLKGINQASIKGVESLGLISEEQEGKMLDTLHRERALDTAAYQPLADRFPGSSLLGEIAGETGPFMNLPVMRVESLAGKIGQIASRPIVGAPLRASPEAALGAAEASVPYAPEDASGPGRAGEAAGGASVARLATDYLSRRANMRRGRLTGEAQEFHELGEQYGVPVRRGSLDDQLDAAENVATEQSGFRGPGELGEAVVNDIVSLSPQKLGGLKKMPSVNEVLKGAKGQDVDPARVINWFTSTPTPGKKAVFNSLGEEGQAAVKERFWNKALESGTRGRQFSPLAYAKALETTKETARQYLTDDELLEYTNLSKLMRHISGRGATGDNSILRLLRGFPFMYRAATDAFRRSNFRYLLRNAPPEIRPGSMEMERFYRSMIRAASIQESGDLSEGAGAISGALQEAGLPGFDDVGPIIGRLNPYTN